MKISRTIVEKTVQKSEKIWIVLGPILTEAELKVRIRKMQFRFLCNDILYCRRPDPEGLYLQLVRRVGTHRESNSCPPCHPEAEILSPRLGGIRLIIWHRVVVPARQAT